MGTWNWLDWTLAAVILVSVATAIRRGFVGELISLATVVAGLIVAALNYQRGTAWFGDLTRSREVALAGGFLVFFLGTLILGALISGVARKLIKTVGIQWFDRFLGGIFGLVRGVVVDAILLMVFVAFAVKPNAVQQSQLAPYVTTGARVIAVAMPADLKGQFRAGFDRFRLALAQTDKATGKD